MTNSEMSKFCNYYVDINSLCMFPHKYSLGLEGVLGPFGWFTRERDLTYGCVCVCVCVCVCCSDTCLAMWWNLTVVGSWQIQMHN